ncbi:hypothetical protein B0A48_17389 [Cryoendolithus antarcticus]|uniref:Glutathione S-transferase n=1 Tax=Cryoendolithus antarcticus TaxID=1507870 RepID=A0A1V8SCN7_9PEZI|nr:hypothetical protein B0A48_17389 [Cryoendolithus antarcticus]
MSMPLRVHHLQVSQSERVVWLCEELGLEYKLELYPRDPLFAPTVYKQMHVLGAAPVIEDENGKLAESAACVEYIAQVYGKGIFFVKPGEKGYSEFLYWFHHANGTLMPALMRLYSLQGAGVSDPENPAVKRSAERVDAVLSAMDAKLSGTRYLAGDEFTAADIMSLVCVTTIRQFAQMDLKSYPDVLKWMRLCSEREGYRRAMAKGDPEMDLEAQLGAKSPPQFAGIEEARAKAVEEKQWRSKA